MRVWCVCVYMCSYECGWTCMCGFMCMCGYLHVTSGVFLNDAPFCLCGLLMSLELRIPANLASLQPGEVWSLPLRAGIAGVVHRCLVSMWVLGTQAPFLMPMQQALYPSHLPSPVCTFRFRGTLSFHLSHVSTCPTTCSLGMSSQSGAFAPNDEPEPQFA